MPYNERLAERVRSVLEKRKMAFAEKRMMGGLCFLVDDKMCVGVEKDRLMVRMDPDGYEAALKRKGAAPMDFTGRPMRGFVFVSPDGTRSISALDHWVGLAIEYNPRAKSSKKREKGGQTGRR